MLYNENGPLFYLDLFHFEANNEMISRVRPSVQSTNFEAYNHLLLIVDKSLEAIYITIGTMSYFSLAPILN